MVVRAFLFDVFGTLVDWRTSVRRQLADFAFRHGIEGVDWLDFTLAWRARYQPSLEEVRSGRRAWTLLDDLHRESLLALLEHYQVRGLDVKDVDYLTHAWHRLEPWPDVVAGLTRLKQRHIIAPCSNGNVALLDNLAKHAGLPWDCILGAEPARAYKPQPEVYLTSCRMLGLAPDEVMMVAAHNSDLAAAKRLGLRTCFIPRPTEYGTLQTTDLEPDSDAVDLYAPDLIWLARRFEQFERFEPAAP
jgi:2-haloacid dehalogenase